MKKIIAAYFVVLLALSGLNISYSQNKHGNRILDLLGQSAYSYLLSANRPGYGVDAFTTEKGKTVLSLGASYGSEVFDFPVSVSYGITDNFELSAGISPYTQNYNFQGGKVSGVGDSYFGMKYSFAESKYFVHAFQSLFKLPTASQSKELGTGKVDVLLGIAQGFVKGKFSYDLSFEVNLLQRRDWPNNKKYPVILQNLIDSTKSSYDYSIEPEIVISGGPSVELSKKVSVYTGFSFSRNTRLNYNSETIYGGFGVGIGKSTGLYLGGSYGLEEAGTWGLSGGLSFEF